MTTVNELSAVCRDAFVVLQGAEEIKYRDGDIWRLEEGQVEHPMTARLRAASLASLLDVPEPGAEKVNDAMRAFLVRLEEICLHAGMPKGHADVLGWIDARVAR